MNRSLEISNELIELQSSLAGSAGHHPYSIPEGYFEDLASNILKRVRALDAVNAGEEIQSLSPLLAALPRELPYTVPARYFDSMPVNKGEQESPGEEIAKLSPMLAGLDKKIPYSVPEDYFNNLNRPVEVVKITGAKTVRMRSRSWFRYAAAALLTGIFLTAGYLALNTEKIPGGKALAKFTRDVKKMNASQMDSVMEYVDAGLNGSENVKLNPATRNTEVKELLEGIPEEELNDFTRQTEDISDLLMLN